MPPTSHVCLKLSACLSFCRWKALQSLSQHMEMAIHKGVMYKEELLQSLESQACCFNCYIASLLRFVKSIHSAHPAGLQHKAHQEPVTIWNAEGLVLDSQPWKLEPRKENSYDWERFLTWKTQVGADGNTAWICFKLIESLLVKESLQNKTKKNQQEREKQQLGKNQNIWVVLIQNNITLTFTVNLQRNKIIQDRNGYFFGFPAITMIFFLKRFLRNSGEL